MFISKKKHYKEVMESARKQSEFNREMEQSDKLWKLESDVKKLKKQVRKLKDIVKNGY